MEKWSEGSEIFTLIGPLLVFYDLCLKCDLQQKDLFCYFQARQSAKKVRVFIWHLNLVDSRFHISQDSQFLLPELGDDTKECVSEICSL